VKTGGEESLGEGGRSPSGRDGMGGVRREEDEVECAEEEIDGGGELGFFVEESSARIGGGKGRGGSDRGLGSFLEARVESEIRDEGVEIVDEVVEIDVESLA
jgi:hypothetical protein